MARSSAAKSTKSKVRWSSHADAKNTVNIDANDDDDVDLAIDIAWCVSGLLDLSGGGGGGGGRKYAGLNQWYASTWTKISITPAQALHTPFWISMTRTQFHTYPHTHIHTLTHLHTYSLTPPPLPSRPIIKVDVETQKNNVTSENSHVNIELNSL